MLGELQRRPGRAPVPVDHQVMGDPVEPGGEWHPLQPVPRQGIDHLEEHLPREIFRVGLVADPYIDVAVDRVNMALIDLGEGSRLQCFGPLEQGDLGRLSQGAHIL